MPKYPISVILYLAKLSIKDKIQDILHIKNNVDAYITIEIKDKNGNIIKKHKQRSHSFVANFLTQLSNVLYYYYSCYGCNTTINRALGYPMGLQIGTGTGTPSPNDTALYDPIQNGTGQGQMQYPTQPTASSVQVNGDTAYFTIQSSITNNSGAPITVTEVGLYAQSNSTIISGLLTHDLLSSPVTVSNETAITITYTISVTT